MKHRCRCCSYPKTRELLDAKPRISETHESCECTMHDPRGAGSIVADTSARNPYAHTMKVPFHESLEHRLT
jgi:hypothetical protein